jgi:hypothetical protein
MDALPVAKSLSASVPFEYWARDLVGLHEVDHLLDRGHVLRGVERGLARRVVERAALLLAQLERQVDVLRDLAGLQGQSVMPGLGELLGVGGELGPGGRWPADPGRGELRLVVVEAVGQAVERDGRRRLAGRPGGREAPGQEPAGAADLVHDRRGEGQEGAGRLE